MKQNIIDFVYKGQTIGDLFKGVEVTEEDGKVYVVLGFEQQHPEEKDIKKELMKYLKVDLGYPGAKVTFKNLVQEELYENTILQRDDILYLLVASGKGGVGKSNVSANLGNVFNNQGYKVAIIDADIYGSSIPNIFGIHNYPPLIDNVLYPAKFNGINIVSVDFLMRAQLPILWRGPMLNRALNHFFYYTKYDDDIQIVIVDLPPGTGDVSLDMAQFMPQAYQIVVTTPHPNAASIAIKAGEMAKSFNHEILGVVENMSYFVHEEEKLEIFGFGGGDMVANTLDVPLLDKLEIKIPENGSLYQEGESNYARYLNIVNNIIEKSDFNAKR